MWTTKNCSYISLLMACHCFQWMLQTPGATSYMGCIGKDKFGEEMKKNAQAAGVTVSFSSHLLHATLLDSNVPIYWLIDYCGLDVVAYSLRLITTRMRLLLLAHVLYVLLVVKGLFSKYQFCCITSAVGVVFTLCSPFSY